MNYDIGELPQPIEKQVGVGNSVFDFWLGIVIGVVGTNIGWFIRLPLMRLLE